MSEMQPDVLVGLPDYRPVELGLGYIGGLERDWKAKNALNLSDPSRRYVGAEFAAFRGFASLAARAGVASNEQEWVTPPALTEDILLNPCLERHSVTYSPIPLPDDPGKFAVLQQVYYARSMLNVIPIRCALPIINIYQRDIMRRGQSAFLAERYMRPDVQFLDAWIRDVRGTPFFACGGREHLEFQDYLKRCTPGDREVFSQKQQAQSNYIELLARLTQPRFLHTDMIPQAVFVAGAPGESIVFPN